MQKSAGQLNALCRLKSFLNTDQRKILVNSFVFFSYNYCPLVWYFCSEKSVNKIERIQYRALQFLPNDSDSHYNLPSLMKKLFNKRNNVNRSKNDLIIYKRDSVTFRSNSLRCLGPHIRSNLLENIKGNNFFWKI